MTDSRRAFLRAGVAAALAGLAGCGYRERSADADADTDGGMAATTPDSRGPLPGETDLPVPEAALRRGAERDAIPAITDPAFAADWSDIAYDLGGDRGTYEPRLAADDLVVGVTVDEDEDGPEDPTAGTGGSDRRDGARARAYPLQLLRWHEAVNDSFGGEPATFGVSGLLWHENLVLYDDRTGSLWSQLLARAIRGPATGQAFALRPFALTSWGEWRGTHPDTEVLLPSPASNTVVGPVRVPYGANLYEGVGDLAGRGGTGDPNPDTRLPKRTLVLGVVAGGEAVAYPRGYATGSEVINDRIGGVPVVVAATRAGTYAYDRRVDGRTLAFEALPTEAGDVLAAGGSRWSIPSGRAIDGPHEGARLRALPEASAVYWFAWVSFHPDTDVWRP
jgi:hypothetical protein